MERSRLLMRVASVSTDEAFCSLARGIACRRDILHGCCLE